MSPTKTELVHTTGAVKTPRKKMKGTSLKQPTVSSLEKRAQKSQPPLESNHMELGSTGRNKIPLPLRDKNCFLHRNRTVSRRNICFVVKLGIVRLVLLQNVVDRTGVHRKTFCQFFYADTLAVCF